MTETEIRQALDGTLTVVARKGLILTRKVAKDFIPSHDYGRKIVSITVAPLRPPHARFTPDEDARLLALMKSGLSLSAIGNRLGRDRMSVYSRLKLLTR
jgi:hypothetical protein